MIFTESVLGYGVALAATISISAAQPYSLVDTYDAGNWLDMFSVQSVRRLSCTLHISLFQQAALIDNRYLIQPAAS